MSPAESARIADLIVNLLAAEHLITEARIRAAAGYVVDMSTEHYAASTTAMLGLAVALGGKGLLQRLTAAAHGPAMTQNAAS